MSSEQVVAGKVAAHTPGPWLTDGVVVWASDDGGQSFDVPVCVTTSRVKNALVEPAAKAPTCGLENAALIASAPDLLAAAKLALFRETVTGYNVGQWDAMVAALRAAIAQAEGR